MTKEKLIEKTVVIISQLPKRSISELANFAEYLLSKNSEKNYDEGIKQIINDSESYSFLENEEDLYSVKDLKEKYK